MQQSSSDIEVAERVALFLASAASGRVSSDELREFEAWLATDGEHRRVFEYMQSMSEDLRPFVSEDEQDSPELLLAAEAAHSDNGKAAGRLSRAGLGGRWYAMAASLVVGVLVATLYLAGGPEGVQPTLLNTGIGERQVATLDDGSSVALNADTRIAVLFSETERRVTLFEGEIRLDVVPEPHRTFVVSVDGHEVRVLGTVFNVRRRDSSGVVTVLEGRVEASAATEESVSRQAHAEQLEGKVALVAGQQLHLGEGSQPVMLSDRELQEQTDWQNGWLHVSAMSLKDLVSYLQPYSARQFRIADGGLDDLTVSGSFNRDDLDAVLAALEALLPVTIRKRSSEIVILQE